MVERRNRTLQLCSGSTEKVEPPIVAQAARAPGRAEVEARLRDGAVAVSQVAIVGEPQAAQSPRAIPDTSSFSVGSWLPHGPVPPPRSLREPGGRQALPAPAPTEGPPHRDGCPTGGSPVPPPRASEVRVAGPRAAPAEAPLPRKTRPSSELFRAKALDAYRRGAKVQSVLRVAPSSSWALFSCLGSATLAALCVCTFGHVEITTQGRGILRGPGGAMPLAAQVPGLVEQTFVRSGDTVAAGDPLVAIDSAEIRVRRMEAANEVALAESNLARLRGRERELFDQAMSLLERRARLLRGRIASQGRSVSRLREKRRTYERLADQNVVARRTDDDMAEQVGHARRGQLGLQEQLAEAEVSMNDLRRDRERAIFEWTSRRDEAKRKRDAASLLLSQATIEAPRAGRVEALVVRPGQLVEPGTPVLRLVPLGQPREVVVFLPEKDRAFVHRGEKVRLELDQLPAGEFGALTGRVTRISTDLASSEELVDALGESEPVVGPHFRVEIDLVHDERHAALKRYLRPGTLLRGRMALRERRIIALAFDPLRRWLDGSLAGR